MKRPTQRRVHGELEITVGENLLFREPAVLDFLDHGGARHYGTLKVADQIFGMRLDGAEFPPSKAPGRPTHLMRDIAVWLACRWFERFGAQDAKGKPRKVAEQVVALWETLKRDEGAAIGITEPSHVRDARVRAQKYFGGMPPHVATASNGAAALLGAIQDIDSSGCVDAFVWDYGTEEATPAKWCRK
jgi:hypothetical protein